MTKKTPEQIRREEFTPLVKAEDPLWESIHWFIKTPKKDYSPDAAAFNLDDNLIIRNCTGSALENLGYKKKDFLKKPFGFWLHPEDFPNFREATSKVAKELPKLGFYADFGFKIDHSNPQLFTPYLLSTRIKRGQNRVEGWTIGIRREDRPYKCESSSIDVNLDPASGTEQLIDKVRKTVVLASNGNGPFNLNFGPLALKYSQDKMDFPEGLREVMNDALRLQ